MTHSLPREKLPNMKTTIDKHETILSTHTSQGRGGTELIPAYVAWLNCVNHVTSVLRLRLLLFWFYFLYFCNFLFFWLFTKRHGRQNLGFDVRHLRFVSRDVTFGFEITSGCRPWLKNISCLSSLIYYLILHNFNMPFKKKKKPFPQLYKTHEFRFPTLLESPEGFGCPVFRFFLFNTDRGFTSSGCFRFRCGFLSWFVEFLNSLRIFFSCLLGSRRDFSTCL